MPGQRPKLLGPEIPSFAVNHENDDSGFEELSKCDWRGGSITSHVNRYHTSFVRTAITDRLLHQQTELYPDGGNNSP